MLSCDNQRRSETVRTVATRNELGRASFSRVDVTRMKMSNDDSPNFAPSSRVEKRRAETDRIFAEMQQRERVERIAKTMRLRKLRLVNDTDTDTDQTN
jgi:hypothetical protein